MPKKVIWEFKDGTISVSGNGAEDEKEKNFSFKLTRYKDAVSRKESLKIECKYDGEDNGHINTNIYSLEKDMAGLMEYGVAFSGSVFADLRQTVKDNYLLLNPEIITELDRKELDESAKKRILKMIGVYLSCDEPGKILYHIPVEEFNSLLAQSEFYKYDVKDIKKWLMDPAKPYIKCVEGRTDNLVRLNKKPTRVISFYAKMMDSIIETHKNDNGEDKEVKNEQ